MRFIGKFFLIAVVCLCAAVPPAPRESRAARLKSDAEVKGLWLTAPGFPDDAESVSFKADDNGEVTYKRSLDGGLMFIINRSPYGGTKTPEEIKEMIEGYVEDSGGDANAIEFDMSAAKIAERLSYPVMRAEYTTGDDDGPNWGAFMCVFTDEFTFLVHLEMPANADGVYKNQMESWFSAAELVNGGGDDVAKEDAPDAYVTGLWLTAPDFPKDAESVEFNAEDDGEVQYTRDLGDLIFIIARSPSGVTETPETAKKTIEKFVEINNGDAGGIEFDENAGAFAEMLTYPVITAKYKVSGDGEPRQGMYLCVFTDEFTFVVLWEAEPGSVGKYKDQLEGWFHNLKFVNAEPGSDESVKEKDPVAVVYTSGGFNGEAGIINGPGGYDLGKDFSLPNDSVCSVRVRPGYKVTLYRNPGFGGEGLENDGDSDELGEWNRVTSSLKVERADRNDVDPDDEGEWLKTLEEAEPEYADLGMEGDKLKAAIKRHAERIEKYHDVPWYGKTTDGERVEMAREMLEIFGDCGVGVDGWTPNSFAQQINNFFDWRPGSVWLTACRILNIDPDSFE